MSLIFVVFACLIFKVSALAITCPDHVETMPDFNPKLYVGDWYSTFSSYNSFTDETSHCVRATYGELSMCPLQIKIAKGPFIYYVITFLGFLDPPPPLRQHVFSTKNQQKLAFSDPPPLQVLT